MPTWDPTQYERFSAARGRPFFDLVAQVAADDPRSVVDLGCGPGGLTETLVDRWPQASVLGIDNSEQMLTAAADLDSRDGRLRFQLDDLVDWVESAEPESVDVLISNATLQWVEDHLRLFDRFAQLLRPGGWLAIQIPGNHDAPLHATLRELAAAEPYAAHTGGASVRFALPDPNDYLRAAYAAGLRPNAWETTYAQVLSGPDPVFEWIKGTGARPVLQALPAELLPRFEREYKERLTEAYPTESFGTVLPFRRVFLVAQRA